VSPSGRLVASVVVTIMLATAASAETARQVLDRRKQLDDTTRHWSDREQHMALTLEKKGSAPQRRALSMYERHLPGREEQALLFFEEPASIKGVGFLAFSHPGRADEQWLYLPALKRVRQIATSKSARSESFVGTDLSFHDLDVLQDMTSWSEADAPATLLGEELIAGVPTYRIELKPTLADVYYPRILLWLGKEDLVTRRTEFFDGGTAAVKRVDQSDVRTVDGIPVAHRLEAVSVVRGSRTVMEVAKVRLNQQLESDLFTQRALTRGKR
jgi:outer membrane lipoprotein-sorting protein